MFPNVPKKDSLDFLSDYYFDTNSPIAFTSPLALYQGAKNVILPLLFVKLRLGYNPKTPTPFINQFVNNFFEKQRVIATEIDDQWQADLVGNSSWPVLTRDTNFYSPALMYFEICLGLAT